MKFYLYVLKLNCILKETIKIKDCDYLKVKYSLRMYVNMTEYFLRINKEILPMM